MPDGETERLSRGLCGADGGSLGQHQGCPGSRQYGAQRRGAATLGYHKSGQARLGSQLEELQCRLQKTGGPATMADYGGSRPWLNGQTHALRTVARRIYVTWGAQRARCNIAAPLIFGRCCYGADCHYITARQFSEHVLGGGRRPDSVRLLAVGGGKGDPEMVRMKRPVKHWQKEAEVYTIADAHWESLAGMSGKQGPASLMQHALGRAGVTCHSRMHWEDGGRHIDVLQDAGASVALGAAVVAARWRRR